MGRQFRSMAIILLLILFIIPAVAATTISIGDVFVEPSETSSAPITIENVTSVGTVDITIHYDQTVVQVTGGANTEFDFMHPVINNSAGYVRIGGMVYGDGLSGDVKLADLMLEAVGGTDETSLLSITINELKVADATETSIPADVKNCTFGILNPPEPPAGLSNATGCHWINWTWTAGSGSKSDFVEVTIDGVWVENCTEQYYNCTFPPHATRTISLRGYNSSLNRYSDHVSQTITIPNYAPVVIAEAIHLHNIVGYQCKAIFDATASHDPDNDEISYEWDFGDEGYGSGSVVEHIYTTYNWNGSGYEPFVVSLRVVDDIGASTTVNIPANVYIAGDTNGDGVVDILDATIVGLEWDHEYGITKWADRSDQADLNNDGLVDILDAVIVGTNWGHVA